jgi:hypothetical protein
VATIARRVRRLLVRRGLGGDVLTNCGCQGQNVTYGQELAKIHTNDMSKKQLIVGNSSWTQKPWTDDFNPTTGPNPSKYFYRGQFAYAGNNPSVAILPGGDMFASGEQNMKLTHVQSDVVNDYEMPLRRNASGRYCNHTKPFGWGPGQQSFSSTQSTEEIGGKIWLTQGISGGSTAPYNHSRMWRFDPAATDSPSTVQDDRFCAYNVPEDKSR